MNRYGKRCVLYPRVSTEMQVDGYSLEGQKNMLTRFADREEMIIVDTYEDAGKSGKSIEGRPAFQKMLRDIEDGLDIPYMMSLLSWRKKSKMPDFGEMQLSSRQLLFL